MTRRKWQLLKDLGLQKPSTRMTLSPMFRYKVRVGRMPRQIKSRAAAGMGQERGCKSTWQLPRGLGWEESLVQVISRRLLYSFPRKPGFWLTKSKARGAVTAG